MIPSITTLLERGRELREKVKDNSRCHCTDSAICGDCLSSGWVEIDFTRKTAAAKDAIIELFVEALQNTNRLFLDKYGNNIDWVRINAKGYMSTAMEKAEAIAKEALEK